MSVVVVISQHLLNVFVQLANKRGFKKIIIIIIIILIIVIVIMIMPPERRNSETRSDGRCKATAA
jgi:competence protein ComGC